MYSIELSNSSSYSAAFDFLSAGRAYAASGTLYTGGCNENGVPGLNCSSACQDPSQIFSNPYTFQNCMVLSALAPNVSNNLNEISVKIASTFSIDVVDHDFPSLARNVTQTIQDCLKEYTNPRTYNYTSFSPWYNSSNDAKNSTNRTGIPVYNITCSSEGEALNADIGGIGVGQSDAPPITKSSFLPRTGLYILLDAERHCSLCFPPTKTVR